MINVLPPPPSPVSPVIPKWLRFGLVWYGMAWHRACYYWNVCMRVYYRLHYDISSHTQHIITQNIECDTYACRHSTWLDCLVYCLARTLTDPNFYGLHSFLTLTHSLDSFALLYSPCVFDLFAICCWLKLKLCEYVRMNKLSRETMTTTMGTLIRFPKVKNPTTKYHILYRRNHVISRSSHTILVSQPPSPSL